MAGQSIVSKSRSGSRALRWTQNLFLLGVFGVAVFAVSMLLAIEHTAQPEFCRTCHNMEPYFQSWKHSAHANVPCIECHYEPGSIETLEGKVKALSQLAKYVTRTAGTKPWAEIGDASCMRSGCHYTRLLEGPIQFGRVQFNHRHHILESRRGRRLRCTTCHAQVMQGSHMSVSENVCFTCHFKRTSSEGPPATSDCQTCHGAPQEAVDVAGQPFLHSEYIQRGIQCQECHTAVVRGEGLVRKERCNSCHGEVGHVERIGETAFLHEMHVTSHKVECFECHEEIHHGLQPLEAVRPVAGDCNSCHSSSHDAVLQMYSGTGAVGIPPAPSRMYQSRIACAACHTGRSGAGDSAVAHASLATAGNIDCLHCHGTTYEGMLDQWKVTVNEQVARLGALLDGLQVRLGSDPAQPARQLYAEAKQNVDFVIRDRSGGAHNVRYALDALRASADRIDRAYALFDPEFKVHALDGLPLKSASGCTSACHLRVEDQELVSTPKGPFQHQRHLLVAKLDCATCHSTSQHGQPSFPRNQCGSCHHERVAAQDPVPECSTCHQVQQSVISGSAAGFKGEASLMAESVACADCHGDAKAVVRPTGESCATCHDESYAQMLTDWHQTIDQLATKVELGLSSAAGRGIDAAAVESARRAFELVRADGSRGAHNLAFSESLLSDAARDLGLK